MLLSPHEVIEPELPTYDDLDKWFTEYANPQLKEHARVFAMGHDVKLKLNAALFKSFWVEVQNRFNEQGWHCHLNTLTGVGSESEITIYIQPRQKQHEAPEATAWVAFQQGYKNAMMDEKPKRVAFIEKIELHHALSVVCLLIVFIGVLINPPDTGTAVFAITVAALLGGFIGWNAKDLFNGT